MSKKVVFIGMGGTIAGLSKESQNNVDYQAGVIDIEQLISSLPGLSNGFENVTFSAIQVAQLDSKDTQLGDLRKLALCVNQVITDDSVDGIVITHGTDTIEETAYFLSRLRYGDAVKSKPIVLTCAMRPASSLVSDGPQNIFDAVTVALNLGCSGVYVVVAGQVYEACSVQKVHPYRLNAFDGGDFGACGYVEEGRYRAVKFVGNSTPSFACDVNALPEFYWPRVEIFLSYIGADGTLLRTACNELSKFDNTLKGVVVASVGDGGIHKSLESALEDASVSGVKVVVSTRCPYGQIVHNTDTKMKSKFHFSPLSPVKARIELILTLLNDAT